MVIKINLSNLKSEKNRYCIIDRFGSKSERMTESVEEKEFTVFKLFIRVISFYILISFFESSVVIHSGETQVSQVHISGLQIHQQQS